MDYDHPETAERSQSLTVEEKEALGIDPQTGGPSASVERFPSGQIKPGSTSLNPAGRPKGSRNKLGEAFVSDLYRDWQEHGLQVLEDARKAKPADYLKVVASILPKDIKVSLETMSDGELNRKIDQLANSLGLRLSPSPKTIDIDPETGD